MEPEVGPSAERRQVELHGDQRDMLQAVLEHDRVLAEMYAGALMVLNDSSNPDRLAQAGHSVRELIEKLPKVLGVAEPVSQLSSEVRKLEDVFVAARESESFRDGNWDEQVDAPIGAIIRAVEELVAWRQSSRRIRYEATREMFRELDPSGRVVPDPLGDLTVREWMQAHRYFSGVAHHKPTDESTFRETLRRFDSLLMAKLRPRPFADFDEIDTILAEAERGV